MDGANTQGTRQSGNGSRRSAPGAALLRIFLGILFALAGIFKVLDQPVFFAGLMQFSFVDSNLLYVLSWVVGPAELLLGLWLLSGRGARAAAIYGATMVLFFSVGLVVAWQQGLEVSCPCFGPLQLGNSYPAWLARNLVFLLAFFWIARRCRVGRTMV